MAASICAAKECARTILFESLRVHAFKGAHPHVMLLVDREPCVLQKVLLEGYRQVLEEYNSGTTPEAHAAAERRAADGDLFVPLESGRLAPCGAGCLPAEQASPLSHNSISYSIVPFEADHFLDHMKDLQFTLRCCGDDAVKREDFETCMRGAWPYLNPLSTTEGHSPAADEAAWETLRTGPPRELLCFILIQREAFQNEMRKYRLRLNLFDMGMRVAEHCHLNSMSEDADRLAEQARYAEALRDDQVYSYARACSLRPAVAHLFGRAIADSIDLFSWSRDGDAGAAAAAPSSFVTALQDKRVWDLLEAEAVRWSAPVAPADAAEAEAEGAGEATRGVVTGAGAPLRIVCRDASKCLTYAGGMEDCLLNTGYYAAAEDDARNTVTAHRDKFAATHQTVHKEKKRKVEEGEGGAAEGGSSAAVPYGRMKKKDYLAMLAAKDLKPNKKKPMDSDDEEAEAHMSGGAHMSSSIGGTFPVGEVISESFDLSQLSGVCTVFAYPDPFKNVAFSKPQPFDMTVEDGVVTAVSDDAPDDLVDLLSLVRQAEGKCYVRELGIGLNPYVGIQHPLRDVTSFERQWGVHLSLGQRHPLFVKQGCKRNKDGTPAEAVAIKGPVLARKAGKYHIDVFIDVRKIEMGKFEMDFTKGVLVK